MGPDQARRGLPSYPGEDTRLTSKKELLGWYAYGFAAEVFVICGMGSFVPVTLEQIAHENGVLLPDRTQPCVPPPNATAPAMLLSRADKKNSCVVQFWGIEVNTTSFAMYVFSLSVAIQAIIVVSISCAADRGNYRKRLLLAFAFTGALATILFIIPTPKPYIFAALLAIVSNATLGASFVLLNSFLPVLVRHHPETQPAGARSPVDNDEESMSRSTTLLEPEAKLTSAELQLSTRISSRGIGIGYIAALCVQCAGIAVLALKGSSTPALRIVLFGIGLWWLGFTIPAAMYLRPRPGPPLPSKDGAKRRWWEYITFSWMSLWRTVKLARRLKDIILFLIAWFLISDAIATVSGTAILYAKTELNMPAQSVAVISVLGTLAGVVGAFGWSRMSRFLGLKPHQTVLTCIFGFELIPLYCLLGYLPFVKAWGVIGLQQPWEMYGLALVYGIVLGGISSYCRSLFGELIPPGSEAAFYALYAITDKGSSMFGPAIVGAIVDATGEIRPAFFFLAALVGLPAIFIWFLDVERGKKESLKMAAYIEGYKDRPDSDHSRGSSLSEGQGLLAAEEQELADRTE